MGLAFQAFFIAVFALVKRWKIVVVFFILNLFFSVFLALPIFDLLSVKAGHYGGLQGFLAFFDPGLLCGFFRDNQAVLEAFCVSAGAGGLFYMLFSHLLSGGMIAILSDPREKTSLKTFFKAFGRFAFRFLRLFFYFLLVVAGLAAVNIALDKGLHWYFTEYKEYASDAQQLGWILLSKNVFMLLLLGFVLLSLNFSKTAVVVDDRHFMGGGILRGFAFVAAHPVTTGLFFVLSLVTLAVVIYAYFTLSRIVDPHKTYYFLESIGGITLSGALVYIAFSQVVQFFIQACLVFRHAGQVYLYKYLTVQHTHPDPELASPDPYTPFIPDRPYTGPNEKGARSPMEDTGHV